MRDSSRTVCYNPRWSLKISLLIDHLVRGMAEMQSKLGEGQQNPNPSIKDGEDWEDVTVVEGGNEDDDFVVI